jgi:hypothetical protein
MNPATLAIVSLIISILIALFGAGMLSRFLNINAENAVRADRQQRSEDKVKEQGEHIRKLELGQALLEQSVESIMARLSKLDMIDGIASDVRFTRESIVQINREFIPRREVEVLVKNVERRVETLEHQDASN